MIPRSLKLFQNYFSEVYKSKLKVQPTQATPNDGSKPAEVYFALKKVLTDSEKEGVRVTLTSPPSHHFHIINPQ